ncbi:MAG: acetyl-CoA carboxylase biotin carboxyl carrier protein [Candidatus Rokubacteria bacterium]|nr:acetyl-CoA carboxylase biotin carboxyl carrier protein [Candidatus Rokubacteria bacterium]
MDLGLIRKLVRLMEVAELSELEVDDTKAGLRVHLRRGRGEAQGSPVVHVVPASTGHVAPQAAPSAAAGAAPAPAGGGPPPGTVPFESPMVGTFYRATSPDAEPFVRPGSSIDEDSVVCIIEAMKVMNEVKAEMRGEIVEVLVENGEPVEFGQPLFLVMPH